MAPVQTRMHGAGTTGSAETSRPSLRGGLTAYFALSLVHRAFWPPYRDNALTRVALDTSVGVSGPRDLTVRLAVVVCMMIMLNADPPTAAHLHVRDDRDPPLFMRWVAQENAGDLPDTPSEIFLRDIWTEVIVLNVLAKSLFGRSMHSRDCLSRW
ncbi:MULTISPECIES: hypothetical protein [unclassified Bradyrhizobium]|uniref:hypothetical protein n=1 Tax=unclassified Bradyrhizobium TaxID=2631580 RepID=UPI0028EBC100|nr:MULTISPECIES: hypothetical protein [unclassified Bradyrhizobium]